MRRLAFAWLRESDWQRWVEIEGGNPEPGKDYADWLCRFSKMEKACQAQGIELVPIEVDPDLFLEWCAQEGKPLDSVAAVSAARGEFVARLSAA